MHKRQQACVRDCVCYARALMVDARVVTDEHGRVGAARKVEYRACDFGGVGTNVIVEQACMRMQARASGIPSVSMKFCGAITVTSAPVAAEKGDSRVRGFGGVAARTVVKHLMFARAMNFAPIVVGARTCACWTATRRPRRCAD